jgi:hypothetical protein
MKSEAEKYTTRAALLVTSFTLRLDALAMSHCHLDSPSRLADSPINAFVAHIRSAASPIRASVPIGSNPRI